MSLPGLALLIAVTMALRAVAAGWANVLMAPLDPLASALAVNVVTVAVTIGDDTVTPVGRALLDGDRTVELIVQAILPETVTVTSGEASAILDTRGSGGKIALTAVHRAIETILQVDASGPWSAMLGRLVLGFDGAAEIRPFLLETEKSGRLAAAEFAYPCRVLESPGIGEPAAGFWVEFVDLMRATPELDGAADLVDALIAGTPLPEWRRLQAVLGLGQPTMVSLGLGPIFDAPDVASAVDLTFVSNGHAVTVSAP